MKIKKIYFFAIFSLFLLVSCEIKENNSTDTLEPPTEEITPPNDSEDNEEKPVIPEEKPEDSDTPEIPPVIEDEKLEITAISGYKEGAYIELKQLDNTKLSDYKISYKPFNSSDYVLVDSELIRENNSIIRCDILGLKEGTYSMKVEVNNLTYENQEIFVYSYDRSGYAHFNNSTAVGAYNNDGTIKNNTTIVYVNELNKNTVTASIAGKTYTGIVNILQAQSKSNTPLIVRILGTIGAATWQEIEYNKDDLTPEDVYGLTGTSLSLKNYDEQDIINAGYNNLNTLEYSKLNNLTNKIKYSGDEFDSYYNMCDISNAKNVTVEGIGNDARIYQWGFTWKNCSYIEVRNLTFEDYPEDACSFEGSDSNATSIDSFKTGYIWFHNNTVLEGKNNWDVCNEQDKHDGDGSIDLKGNKNITISYNHFIQTHKTGLVGGSDSVKTANVTFHHNFYENCGSRLPLGRQANMHMYNNYYYGSTGTNMSIRAGGYAFIENCLFENCNNPIDVKSGDNKIGAVKSYNNSFINCRGTNAATIVSSRTATITNQNIYNQVFDIDSNSFYYNSTTQTTNVKIMTPLENVKDFVTTYAGVLTGNFIYSPSLPEETPPVDTPVDPPINSSITINFNDFPLGSISHSITNNSITVVPLSGKTTNILETNTNINNTLINQYVEFGGGGNFDSLCIKFTTTKTANITVYYSVNADNRYVSLYNFSGLLESSNIPTTKNNDIISYTFENVSPQELAICSKGSRLGIYAIVIEYVN